ncbi:shTK domain protein [Ancylostoma caninum]|uniref:ShTK domain protein n=1 Tax=Ancylostoma caninum TaxID=29170 RepID=A0A368H6J2_ANCCA|nr:shTK domain protein [Ancylostoma caninum]
MFLYALTLLLILNAFTQDVVAEACVDRVPAEVCKQIKEKGNCKDPAFEMIAKMHCAKTCGRCHQ